jgi:DNA-directed RNA polymerase II subunit RPB2
MDKIDKSIGNEHVGKLVDLYFNRNGILYSHLFNSFNKFVDEDIKNILRYGDNQFYEKITKNTIIRYKFKYDNINIIAPLLPNNEELMFPMDARDMNLRYSSKIVATVTQIQEIIDIATEESTEKIIGSIDHNVPIAVIPIMVKSKFCSLNIKPGFDKRECDYDPGGYFIINGSEKVVLSLEKLVENKPLVFYKHDINSDIYSVQVNSRSQKLDGIMQVVSIKMKKDNIMIIKLPVLNETSVFILFRALGIESDKDIINCIVHDLTDTEMISTIKVSLEQSKNDKDKYILTQEDAIEYLISKLKVPKKYAEVDKHLKPIQKRIHIMNLLENHFLPHISCGRIYKAYYLGYMINKLINGFLKRKPFDDRDSFVNKRIDLVGNLLEDLFRQFYKKTLNECNKFFKKRNIDDNNPLNIINQIKSNIIELGINNALLRGDWGKRKGASQILQRQTYLHSLTSLRRVNSPTIDASTVKLTNPRYYHPSQTGFLCPVESPEGHNIGIIKNLTLIGNITISLSSQIDIIKNLLTDKLIDTLDELHENFVIHVKVFLNGEWLGMSDNAYVLYNELYKNKMNGVIDMTVSIVYDIREKEIRIFTDGGRLFRPVFKVDNNELLLKTDDIDGISLNKSDIDKISDWNEFLIKNPGKVCYLDIEESEYALVSTSREEVQQMHKKMNDSLNSMNEIPKDMELNINRYDKFTFKRFTHCEIHPSYLLGILATNIPFCNHNQGPRNIYQFAQGKQATCIYCSNYRFRYDISYILYHPQRPLVTTKTNKYTYSDILACGENVIVAVATYTGFNQEDSIVFNKASIDRGLFRTMSLRKYAPVIHKNQSTSQDDIFTKPDPDKTVGMRQAVYDKLNEHGYVPEETPIQNGDVIIGKISPIPPNGKKIYKESSEIYKFNENAVVDKVLPEIRDNDGYEMIKMRTRSERIPKIADKFCCYTPDHDVLTDKGWVNITELTLEHKVATLVNHEELKYEHPTEIQKYENNEEIDMYDLNSNQVKLTVTMNHRMYVGDRNKKYKIKEARDIVGKLIYYKKNVEVFNPTEIKNTFILPAWGKFEEKQIDMDAWLIFFGIWIAEGCVNHSTNRVIMAAHKQRVKDALRICCKTLSLKIFEYRDKITDGDKLHHWEFSDKLFVYYLKPLSNGSIKKYLPEWCFNLTMDQSKLLLHGMMLGDGHTMANGTERYDTSSIQLANDFQKVCLHAGYSTNISIKYKAGHESKFKNKEGSIISTVDAYRMSIIKSQNMPSVNKTKQSDKVIKYKGNVYCCTVPSGILYVKKDGYPVWCGNSRHGQKGTCGLILSQSDMPFTKDGIIPDLIMNPCAFPSRMTVGHLLECIIGKVSAIQGLEADGTPFNNIDVNDFKDELEKLGFNNNGTEYLYNGMTGHKMKVEIFIGPTFYQRLKHLVMDKIHSRARGPVTLLTRQPPEGRSRDGGLRFGEMERDAVISHGMAKFLKERLMDTSDAYTTYVCDLCGLFAQRLIKRNTTASYSSPNDIYYCVACKNKTHISKIMIPYAFKLFIQELMAMSIAPRIRIDNSIYTS